MRDLREPVNRNKIWGIYGHIGERKIMPFMTEEQERVMLWERNMDLRDEEEWKQQQAEEEELFRDEEMIYEVT